jgi:hypothetical protein
MLARAEEMLAEAEAKGGRSEAEIVAELLKAPKAFFAKHGRHLDDVIDASISEGRAPAPAAEDDNPRLTALEKRIESRERAEQQAQQDRAIAERKAEIHREIKGNAKFPLINESDRAGAVTDFMVEYHSIHGKPIGWDKAASMVEADLKAIVEKGAKKLGWTAPAPKAAAAPPAARPGTVSLSGDQRTSAPTQESLPDDPEKLMAHLVRQAEAGLLKTG